MIVSGSPLASEPNDFPTSTFTTTGTSSAVINGSRLQTGPVVETATASDSTNRLLIAVRGTSEAASANDTPSTTTAIFRPSVAETGVLVDATNRTANFVTSITESGSIVATVNAVASVFVGSTIEVLNGTDAIGTTAIFASAVIETGTILDATNTSAIFVTSTTESGSMATTGDFSGSTYGSVIEVCSAVDTVNVIASTYTGVSYEDFNPNPDHTLDVNFLTGFVDSRITFTRSTTATYFDSTGVLRTAAINLPRVDYDPGTQATNSLRNSTMVGAVAGTPGTLPTNWNFNTLAGLSQQVVAVGIEDGINYIDIRVFGTSSGTALALRSETTTQVAALQNQIWTNSACIKIVGGTTTNVTSIALSLSERTGAGANVASVDQAVTPGAIGASLGVSRFSQTWTLPDATTAFLTPSVNFNVTTASAIDITLRIGANQLEQSSTLHNFIATSTTALSVPALVKGLLLEEARTNAIRNSTMVGAIVGTPGTLPTTWQYQTTNSLATQVVDTGTENGLPYTDVRIFGTSAGLSGFYFGAATGITALTGQIWTASAFLRLTGGSLANITTLQFRMIEYTSGGGAITAGVSSALSPTAAALSTQRSPFTYTTTGGATTAALLPGLQFTAGAGAVDVTLRIGAPQLELGASASSYIPTSTVAVTRSLDLATMATSGWYTAGPATLMVEGIMRQPTVAATNAFWAQLDDSTTNNRITILQPASGLDVDSVLVSGGVAGANQLNRVTNVIGSVFRYALTVATGTYASCGNGGTVDANSSVAYVLPVSITRLQIGTGGTNPVNGHIRRVKYWQRTLTSAELRSNTGSFIADTPNRTTVFIPSVTETGTAVDVGNRLLAYNTVIAESVSVIDTASTAPSTFTGSILETGTAVDVVIGGLQVLAPAVGLEGTLQTGLITTRLDIPATGVQAVAHQGEALARIAGDLLEVNITSVVMTGAIGLISPSVTALVTGVSMFGQVGIGRGLIFNPGLAMTDLEAETIPLRDLESVVSIRWSRTNGASWDVPLTRSLGSIGQYQQNILVRNIGIGRDLVVELSWSAPAMTAISGIFLETEQGNT